jgi:hypothetical protein
MGCQRQRAVAANRHHQESRKPCGDSSQHRTGAGVRGYVVDAEFPSALEPDAVATDAFIVNCDDNPFTLTVISNSGSAAFDFL